MNNLLKNIPVDAPEEVVDTILTADSVRLERIVSNGQSSPSGFWYDQDEHEWVVILKGRAGLRLENEAEARELNVGDSLNIPAHCRHRVEWTDSPTVWLCVFYK
ncbi:cupin domain-containing protein [Verrucomicrobiota bacterium]